MDVICATGVTVTVPAVNGQPVKTLLHAVDLAVTAGAVTALLGPNGAGKSTLLKVLSGSLKPAAGNVSLNGRPLPVWTPRECARQRAVLLQDFHMPFAFSVQDIAAMGRHPHGGGAADSGIVRDCLHAAQLWPLRDRLYPGLSGGERQRAHWARVLAQLDLPSGLHGKCLLLDEPTASLDLAHQHTLLRKARALASGGCAVLVILHDLNLAAQYADHLVLLKDGRVATQGKPEAVMTPAHLRTVYGIDAGVIPHPDHGKPWMFVRAPKFGAPGHSDPEYPRTLLSRTIPFTPPSSRVKTEPQGARS